MVIRSMVMLRKIYSEKPGIGRNERVVKKSRFCCETAAELGLDLPEARKWILISQCMRDLIPLMGFLKELSMCISIDTAPPKILCKIFEDNQGCVDIVNCPKMRRRMKNISLKYHHFRSHVNKTITIEKIKGTNLPADIFTKPLDNSLFRRHRMSTMRW